MNTRSFLNSLAGLALLATTQSAVAESLHEIYKQALLNDQSYIAAQADLSAGREIRHISKSPLLPSVALSADWSQSNTVDNLAASENSDAETTATNYGITVSQSLFNLASWKTYQRGKHLANSAEAGFVKAEQDLIFRTAQTYLDALKSVDNAGTAKAEEEALSHQLEQSKQRFQVGLTAITEVHEAQAAYDSATANRLIADGNMGIAFEAFDVLTGRAYKQLSPLAKGFAVGAPQPLARQDWESIARENNPDLKKAWFDSQSAKAQSDAKKSAYLPTVRGQLSYGGNDTETDGFPVSEGHGTTVKVTVNVPLYTGGLTTAESRQAKNQLSAAKARYAQIERSVMQSVRSSHLGVRTSAATVKARQQAITSSRSALEATQAGYDVGTRDLVDVLNAQRNLYRAERDYHDSLYSYILATLQLKTAAGILAEDDLIQLDLALDKANPVSYQ